MQISLFEETVAEVEMSPAQEQAELFEVDRAAHKREVDRLRQRRHRARQREKGDTVTKCVTVETESRPLDLASRSNVTPAPVADTPEIRLLLDAFSALAASETEATRPNIESALDSVARERGFVLLSPSGFLDSAFEKGLLPKFSGVEWVKVPREVLSVLLAVEK